MANAILRLGVARRSGTRLSAAAIIAAVLIGLGAQPALAVPAVKPPTVVVWPGPRLLAASGAIGKVRARVTNAVRCQVELVNKRARVTVAFSTHAARCNDGRFEVEIKTGPNMHFAKSPVVLEITARGPGGVATTRVEFKVKAFPEVPAPAALGVAPIGPPQTAASPTQAQSENWSGYVVPSATSVTYVSGDWVVPTLDCVMTPSAEVGAWVGTGGAELPNGTSGTLLQTGLEDECLNGTQFDLPFWEMYPSTPNVPHSFNGFSISPGDDVRAAVYQGTTGAWVTRIDDLSTGVSGWMVTGEGWGVTVDTSSSFAFQGTTTGLAYSGSETAEWIVEDPGTIGNQTVLADYGAITFSNLSMALSSWSLYSSYEVTLVNAGTAVSTPSQPSGASFAVSYAAP